MGIRKENIPAVICPTKELVEAKVTLEPMAQYTFLAWAPLIKMMEVAVEVIKVVARKLSRLLKTEEKRGKSKTKKRIRNRN
jgi:hypothetical protein